MREGEFMRRWTRHQLTTLLEHAVVPLLPNEERIFSDTEYFAILLLPLINKKKIILILITQFSLIRVDLQNMLYAVNKRDTWQKNITLFLHFYTKVL